MSSWVLGSTRIAFLPSASLQFKEQEFYIRIPQSLLFHLINPLFQMQEHGAVEDIASKDLDGLRLVILIRGQGDESQTVLSREWPLGLERRWEESDAGRVQGLQEKGDH